MVLRHRVLWLLVLAALPAVFMLAFVRIAPNRLVSGEGVTLLALMSGARHLLCLPTAALVLAMYAPSTRAVHAAVAVAAAVLLAGLCWLAGDEAVRQSGDGTSLARVSLGGGFWLLVLLAWLAASDALQRLG